MNKGTYEWLKSVAVRMGDDTLLKMEEESNEAYTHDNFSLLIHPFEDVQSSLAEVYARGYLQEKNVDLDDEKVCVIETIFTHYEFFEEQLGAFFETYEPEGCDYDKASFVLNSFLHFIATGKHVSFVKGEKEFWKPQHGTAEQWIDFVSTLISLYRGRPQRYLKSYAELVDLYMVGVEEEKKRLHAIITSFPQYQRHEEKGQRLYYHLASGEETGKVEVDVVGGYHVSYYTPEMKGVRLMDKIKHKLTFATPDWIEKLTRSLKKNEER